MTIYSDLKEKFPSLKWKEIQNGCIGTIDDLNIKIKDHIDVKGEHIISIDASTRRSGFSTKTDYEFGIQLIESIIFYRADLTQVIVTNTTS